MESSVSNVNLQIYCTDMCTYEYDDVVTMLQMTLAAELGTKYVYCIEIHYKYNEILTL